MLIKRHKNILKCILLIINIFILNFIVAQDQKILFESYSTNEGLSQSSVVTIFQDDEGFLWFGTYGGLNRFDGYNFKRYQFNVDNPKGISHNHVRSICQDTTGILWVATIGGLNRFFTHEEEFIHFIHNPNDSNSIAEDEVYKVFKDSDGDVWVGTFGQGLDKMERIEGNYNSEKDVQYRFLHHKPITGKNSLSNERISSIDEAQDGSLWIGSFGLNNYNKKTNKFKIYWNNPKNINSLSSNSISALCVDNDGYIWAGTWGAGLNRLDPKTDSVIRFEYIPEDENSISHSIIMSLFCDKAGKIWVATWGGGLNKVESIEKPDNLNSNNHIKYKITRYQQNKCDQSSISGNSIYSIFEDQTGMMWVGTDWSGINKFSNMEAKFKLNTTKENLSGSIVNNVVSAFLFDKNHDLWIATQGGLNVFEQKTNKYKLFKHDPKDAKSLSNNHIRSLLESRNGTIWVGTIQGLNKFIPETGKFKRYYINPDNPGNTNNLALYESKDGMIWIGNYSGGLYRFNPVTEKFDIYENNPDDNKSISDNQVWDIIEDKKGILWVGTAKGGLCRFDRNTGVFTSFQNNKDDSTSISSNHVISLFIDHNENLWVGTVYGLNKLIYNNKGEISFKSFTTEDGLAAHNINGIVEDDFNKLWLTTSNGLTCFDPVKNIFTNYNVEDGLQDNEFSIHAIIKDKITGEIYAGGINGYNIFQPKDIHENSLLPKVKIVELKIFNRRISVNEKIHDKIILSKTISALDEIKLSYKEYVFSFDYAALHYQSPQGNMYAYMLEGFDKEWNYVGNQRTATFTNLNPGKYIFRVKASNSDNLWNEEGASIKIRIVPPWWKTIFFRIFLVFLIISIALGSYFLRVNRLEKQKLLLEELVNKRTIELKHKNESLIEQTMLLNESNTLLEERQQQVEEQTEELKVQAENLNVKNTELNRLNITKDKFFSIIAHDLRNPFNSIMGFSEMLLNKYDKFTDDKRLQFVESIFSSSKKVFDLLENLLQWARTQTGNTAFKKEIFILDDLVDYNIELFKDSLNEKEITVEKYMSAGIEVYADKNMISTILRNLIGNSIKFTEKGKIKIKTGIKDGFCEVEIADTGMGIPENKLISVFEIDNSKITEGTRGESGTGLGLIICKEFIDKNGGYINVKSKHGEGTVFTVLIPTK